MTALAASALTAGFTGWWWIVLLGVVAAGIIAAQSAVSEAQSEGEIPSDTEYDINQLDPSLHKSFQELLETRNRIVATLEELRDHPLLEPDTIADRVNFLVNRYYDLLLKLKKIKPFISEKAIGTAKEAIARLEAQAATSSDEVTKENLAMALRNKTDELHRLMELQTYRKRIESQLENVVSALNSLHLRIVHVSVTPGAELQEVQEVNESITKLITDMDISERVNQEFQRIIQAHLGSNRG